MKEKREKRLEMRLTVAEYQMIAQAAREAKQTMALWAREHLVSIIQSNVKGEITNGEKNLY